MAILKQCTKCKEWLELDCYSNNKSKGDGLCPECKACAKVYSDKYKAAKKDELRVKNKQYRARNQDSIKAYRRKYGKENKEKIRAYKKLWEQRNPDYARQYRKKNRIKLAADNKAWGEKNKDRRRATCATRRARKVNAAGYGYTKKEHFDSRFDMWGNKCWMCGGVADTVDHVKPLDKGGSHWPANLRPACFGCNSSKKNSWLKGGEPISEYLFRIKDYRIKILTS